MDPPPRQWIVRDNIDKHRFEIELGNGIALAEYMIRPGRIVFTHTEVPPGHQGQGIGTALVRAGLAFARKQGLKVSPVCPFFAEYIRDHAEEQDLLDPSWREKLGIAAS